MMTRQQLQEAIEKYAAIQAFEPDQAAREMEAILQEWSMMQQAIHNLTQKWNGWTNRETWLVDTWASNNRDLNDEIYHLARSAEYPAEAVKAAIEHHIESLEDDQPIGIAGLRVDLLNQALARVEWQEIVNSFRD